MELGDSAWTNRRAGRPLTLEHRLLLACARPAPEGPHLQALVARGPDWPRLLRQVERWGLAPLVYTHLQPAAHAGHVPSRCWRASATCTTRTPSTAWRSARCCG